MLEIFTAHGVAAAPGIAIGEVFVLDRARLPVPHRLLDEQEVPAEVSRLREALATSRGQLERLLEKVVAKSIGSEHTYILEAHLLMLEDPELFEGVQDRIHQGINAEWGLKSFLDNLKERFSRIDDEYLQERGNDIDQLGQRVLRNLLGGTEDPIGKVPPGAILLAHDLSPADTAEMGRGRISGFVTEVGGRTSHVAILARSMGIPAVVGVESLLEQASTGELAILDGLEGKLILRPSCDVLEAYREARKRLDRSTRDRRRNRAQPAITQDGVQVSLQANLELLDEVNLLSAWGAEGVGMFRTEYLFLAHGSVPSEEQQYETYRALVQECGTQAVTIRTFDLGGDKVPTEEDAHAANPALGFRAVRYSLHRPEIFERQLRACLRASAHGPLSIMIPMISTLAEVREVKRLLARCRQDLEAEGVRMAPRVPLGIMVETPSAALMADYFAREVDFFSLGTNDLIQYTLAVDRLNDQLNYLYQPLHPAIMRLIRFVARSAAEAGIPVSVCGEMAGEPVYAYALLGLGLRRLSMSPVMIPEVKEMVRSVDIRGATELLDQILASPTSAEDAGEVVRAHLERIAPDLL